MTFDEFWASIVGKLPPGQWCGEALEDCRVIAMTAWNVATNIASGSQVSGVHHVPESDHDRPSGCQRP
jgi:hypothetical protein